jgi:hypothetical protein
MVAGSAVFSDPGPFRRQPARNSGKLSTKRPDRPFAPIADPVNMQIHPGKTR